MGMNLLKVIHAVGILFGGQITFVQSQHVDVERVWLVLSCSKPKGIVYVVGGLLVSVIIQECAAKLWQV